MPCELDDIVVEVAMSFACNSTSVRNLATPRGVEGAGVCARAEKTHFSCAHAQALRGQRRVAGGRGAYHCTAREPATCRGLRFF